MNEFVDGEGIYEIDSSGPETQFITEAELALYVSEAKKRASILNAFY